MSDDDIANIYDAVRKEHFQLGELYSRADNFQHLIMDVMHTNSFVDIINNAQDKLASIGINIFKHNYSQYYDQLNANARYSLMPSIDMEHKLLEYIASDSDAIIMTVNNYNSMFLYAINYLDNANNNSNIRVFGGTMLGGAIAGLAFGPIGAIIGGLAAGSFVEDKSREHSEDEFRYIFEALTNEFKNVYCDVGTYLDDMTDKLICITNNYRESLLSQRQLHY